MIENDIQHQTTLIWAQKFRIALKKFDGPRPEDIHPELWEAEKAATQSLLSDLERELEEYEKCHGMKKITPPSLTNIEPS